MNPLPYVISKSAVLDLEEIWLFTAEKWSIEQADRYYSLLFDEIEYICSNVNSGKSMDLVRKGYRASKVKSHLIFYRVNKNVIEITRILHERMDFETKLSD
jgi:toxin ParE1/3/4